MAIAAAFPALDASAEVRGRCLKRLLGGEYASTAAGETVHELRGAVACMSAGASCPRLLRALASALHAEEDVLATIDGLAQPTAPVAADSAAPEAEQHPEEQHSKSRRATKRPALGGGQKSASGGSGGSKPQRDEGKVDSSLACHDCGSRAGDMLLCDFCEKAFHLECLDPPLAGKVGAVSLGAGRECQHPTMWPPSAAVPVGDWFCAGCEADMAAGMGEGTAVRVLGLLLEEESPRVLLLRSGLLARLLPCLDALLGARVGALCRSVAEGGCAPAGEGAAAASAALVVYAKACLHLHLAVADLAAEAAPAGVGGAPLPSGVAITSDGQRKQALECMQQAMHWASALVKALSQADVDDLLEAVVSQVGSAASAAAAAARSKSLPALTGCALCADVHAGAAPCPRGEASQVEQGHECS